MLNDLLIKVIKDKKSLLSQFDNLFEDISSDSILAYWNNHKFQKNKPVKELLAVDGSINNENLVLERIYALSSHAIYSSIDPGTEIVSTINQVEIMPASKEDYNKIFHKQMNIFELKTILNSLYTRPEADYILIDGDIFSTLNHVASIVNTSIRNNPFILNYTHEIVEQQKNDFTTEVPSIKSIIDKIPKEINIPINEVVLYIQMIEQLCILKNILQKYSKKLVCISKTSRSSNIINHHRFSDLSLFSKFSKKSGYSDEEFIEDTRFRAYINNKIQYGQYPIFNDFFKNLKFKNRFVKLSDKASVIKVQLAYDATEEEFLEVLENLHSFSLEKTGYPFLLKKAHDMVKITGKDMKIITKQLGKYYDEKERNVL